MGWRPHDLERSYVPFVHGFGVQVGMSDPVFMARYGKQPVTNQHPEFPYDPAKFDRKYVAGDATVREDMFLGMEWIKETHTYHDWDDVKFLRDNWEGPLVLKGILNTHVRAIFFDCSNQSLTSGTVQDAEKALTYGVDGIVISNHGKFSSSFFLLLSRQGVADYLPPCLFQTLGGRQVDGAIPALLALETIMKSPTIQAAQSSGQLTIFFDSGIRTGSDIIKALALGAQAVLRMRLFKLLE